MSLQTPLLLQKSYGLQAILAQEQQEYSSFFISVIRDMGFFHPRIPNKKSFSRKICVLPLEFYVLIQARVLLGTNIPPKIEIK